MEGCHAGFPDLPIQLIRPVHVHQAWRSWHCAWQRQRLMERLFLEGKEWKLKSRWGCFQVDTGFLDPSAGPNLPDIHGTEIQGCWGVPNPMKIPKRWQATTSEPFNCDWDRNNWRMGWSQPKKSYCCTLAHWVLGLADDPRDSAVV